MIKLVIRKQEQNSPSIVSANGRMEKNLVKEVQEKENREEVSDRIVSTNRSSGVHSQRIVLAKRLHLSVETGR